MNTHHFSKTASFQVADLVDLWQIVDCKLKQLVLLVGVAESVQELEDCFPQVDFVASVLLKQFVHELGVSELETRQMGEVNRHRGVLIISHFLGNVLVVVDGPPLLDARSVIVIVGIVFIELKSALGYYDSF